MIKAYSIVILLLCRNGELSLGIERKHDPSEISDRRYIASHSCSNTSDPQCDALLIVLRSDGENPMPSSHVLVSSIEICREWA
nr:hypothetical protein CFP56_00293 [Quercus suber]